MTMPNYDDIWETTDTVVMEQPRSWREDGEQPAPGDEEPPAPDGVFVT